MTRNSDNGAIRCRRFYGRRKGHQLHGRQAALMEALLPEFRIDPDAAHPDLARLFPGPVDDIWLEIGFGAGEHLLWQAERNPRTGLIGCEPYINGVAKILGAIDAQNLTNIRLYDDDVHDLFAVMPDRSLARVFILFPDPWPKKRHHKRRIISIDTLDHVARLLKPDGEFRFASDIPEYVDWSLRRILAHGAFRWQAGGPDDWRRRAGDWPPTRYETKAVAAGRTPAYLRFQRL